MNRQTISFKIFTSLFLVFIFLSAPLLGAIFGGHSPVLYLEFPPRTVQIDQPSYSWVAFILIALFVFLTTYPFWKRMLEKSNRSGIGDYSANNHKSLSHSFPLWGWIAFVTLILFWIMAWNRFAWFEPLQRLTFFPLWFSFIVLLNAFSVWYFGKSLMTRRPGFFAALFPVSAIFWWSFEYLNRFVNNWHYIGIGNLGGGQYFLEATLAFSTVLPAVMSIRFILLHTKLFPGALDRFPALPWLTSGYFWGAVGFFSVLILISIGLYPAYTFPFVWIVPGLLWVSFQKVKGYVNPLIKRAAKGNLNLLWASALSALICGFFWEMWNIHSEAKWVYNIPAVDRFHIFEMPVLGYAGYLPFGVVCALISNSLLNSLSNKDQQIEEE